MVVLEPNKLIHIKHFCGVYHIVDLILSVSHEYYLKSQENRSVPVSTGKLGIHADVTFPSLTPSLFVKGFPLCLVVHTGNFFPEG